MDLTQLCKSVRRSSDDIITEVLFQDWLGVSPSEELRLPETDREKAIRMMRHARCDGWISDVGAYFEGYVDINDLRHRMSVVVFNDGREVKYRVSLKFVSLMKYNRYGNNLVRLLVDMLKAKF